MPGRLIILSGPSGVGKDTVIDAWRVADPRVERAVAYTTRSPRAGETHGLDYHFVPESEFLQLAEAGHFLEHKNVHGNYYATPLTNLERMLADGKIAILKIDVQGALEAMELRPDAESVFLLPPDPDELARRIKERGTDSPEAIEKRLRNAEEEIRLSERYDHRIVNHDVNTVVNQLRMLFG